MADPEPVAECGLTEGEVTTLAEKHVITRDGVRRIAALGYARGWEARGERDAEIAERSAPLTSVNCDSDCRRMDRFGALLCKHVAAKIRKGGPADADR